MIWKVAADKYHFGWQGSNTHTNKESPVKKSLIFEPCG